MKKIFKEFKRQPMNKKQLHGNFFEQILQRNRTLILRISEAALLNKYNTIAELDFAAGFYTGEVFNDLRNGVITQEDYDTIKDNLEIIHKSRREILENE